MNKPLAASEFAIPVGITRREKLLRFARIVRETRGHLFVFSNLEHYGPSMWMEMEHPKSAFALAAADPILKDAGLRSGSVGDAQKFFELRREELHEFSCDCGGSISNDQMADRIERLASR